MPPITGVQPAEPTGAGDAFRAGFLAATPWGLRLERAAQLGNLMAVQALERSGRRSTSSSPGPLAERFAAVYGAEAAGGNRRALLGVVPAAGRRTAAR